MDEAESLYREALAIDRKAYGNEHPDVAIDLNNLAGLCRAQVRVDLFSGLALACSVAEFVYRVETKRRKN